MHEPSREGNGFRLREHPWWALFAVMGMSVVAIAVADFLVYGLLGLPGDDPTARFAHQLTFHLLAGFVFFPFVLRLPKGRRGFADYLRDIGLGPGQPFGRLILLGLTCGLILAASQILASVVYWWFEGGAAGAGFLREIVDLSRIDPSDSPDLLLALPSAFEEVAFRGVVLTVFLSRYSVRRSIVFSSVGFSLMHLLNLTGGRELEWVLGQLVWTFILALFYGYVFVRTRSLIPSMTVHVLGNATVNALSGFVLGNATIGTQVVYQIVFSFGLLPTLLMILWARWFTKRWLPVPAGGPSAEETAVVS